MPSWVMFTRPLMTSAPSPPSLITVAFVLEAEEAANRLEQRRKRAKFP